MDSTGSASRAAGRKAGLLAAGIGGLAATVCYVGTVIAGGLIVPGYSHLSDSVSELTSPGAPYGAELAIGFIAYNVAVVAVGAGVLMSSRRSWLTAAAAVLLIATGVAGVLMIQPFPQDPMGTPLTAAGTGHIVLAGVSALGLVAATVLCAFAWRSDPVWGRVRWLSLGAGVAILATGAVGAAMIASPYFGLFERFTQVSFLTWFTAVGVTGLRAIAADRRGVA